MGVLVDLPCRLCSFGCRLVYLDRIVIQRGSTLKSRPKSKKTDAFCSGNCRLTDCGDKIKRDAERKMMMMKFHKNQNTSKNTAMTISIAIGLAIGLGLGILFGSMADDIVRGMTIGTAVGLCGGLAAGASGGKQKEVSDEEKRPDENNSR